MTARKKTSKRTSKPSKSRSRPRPWRSRLWRFLAALVLLLIACFMAWWGYLDYSVRERFGDTKWELAARLYARPLELYQGALMTKPMLERELRELNYQPVDRVTAPGQMHWRGNRVEIYRRAYHIGQQQYHAELMQVDISASRVSKVQSQTGASLASLEPREIGAIYPDNGEDRILTRLQDIPPLLGEALLAVEDRQFMHHHGISVRALGRAIVANVKAGSVVQGGSTLTQQLVKNLFLTNERSLSRKINEALMTLSLEWHYSKSDILAAYINEVYLGQAGSRAIHGFALAAQFYFNKSVADLDEPEIALLIGLVKGASFYNPWRYPERAKSRRDLVLKVMHDSGLIDAQVLKRSQAANLGVVETPTSQHAFPAFVALVKAQLLRDYPLKDLQSEGLQIYTTLAPSVQFLAEQSVAEQITSLERSYNLAQSTLQAGLVVTKVGSGEVRAMIGDRNPRYPGFNRAKDAKRAVGSLIKPALYLTALQQQPLTLASVLDDGPFELTLDNGDIWSPKNFADVDHGQVLLYQALAKSYNQAAARLGMSVGVEQVLKTLRRLGWMGEAAPLPAVLLGALEMSPLEVSQIYHSLANDGIYTPLRAIREVYSADGERLNRYPLEAQAAAPPEFAYLVNFALQVAARQGTGRAVYQQLPENLSVAGKTGTTNDQRDSWFAGYSGSDLAVVWLGTDDNQPLPLTGATGALPVWSSLMADMPQLSFSPGEPDNVQFIWVDATTGLLSREDCVGAVLLPFVRGSEPRQRSDCQPLRGKRDSWWKRIWRD